jgi:hypothetical protein
VRVHRNCLVARDFIRGFERRVNDDGDRHWEVLLNGVAERCRSRADSSSSSGMSGERRRDTARWVISNGSQATAASPVAESRTRPRSCDKLIREKSRAEPDDFSGNCA